MVRESVENSRLAQYARKFNLRFEPAWEDFDSGETYHNAVIFNDATVEQLVAWTDAGDPSRIFRHGVENAGEDPGEDIPTDLVELYDMGDPRGW